MVGCTVNHITGLSSAFVLIGIAFCISQFAFFQASICYSQPIVGFKIESVIVVIGLILIIVVVLMLLGRN